MSCTLCRPTKNVIHRGKFWTVVLNDDQGYLGRSYFALNRHETDVTKIEPAELAELWQLFAIVKASIDRLFQPDHYNYVFLMNVEAHLHGHIIPRYRDNRVFHDLTFTDGALGRHYDLANVLMLPESAMAKITAELQSAMDAEIGTAQ